MLNKWLLKFNQTCELLESLWCLALKSVALFTSIVKDMALTCLIKSMTYMSGNFPSILKFRKPDIVLLNYYSA